MSGGIYTTEKSKSLLGLDDVDVNNLANGQALIYDATTETFTNQNIDNELSSISTVANELIKKDETNTNFVRAHILSTASSVGALTKQKTTFVNSQPPLALPLSSIESVFDNGFYSMIINPHEGNPLQKGMTILAINDNIRVGINVANPTEDFEIDGNIQLDSNNQNRIIFYDTQDDHEHAEIDAFGEGTNGGQLRFYTKVDGGVVTEKMRIAEDGNVGIGLTNPSEKLEVNGTVKTGNDFYVNDILHKRYSASSYQIEPNLGWTGTQNARALLVLNQYNASIRVYNNVGGEITSVSPYENGVIYHRGNFSNVSDDRLKSYETDVSNATEIVMKMNPKFYKKHPTLITDDPAPDLSGVLNFDEYGFIAQELNEDSQLSHFVNKNPNEDIYHVNYIEMIPLLVQTIKELNERINVLENK